MAIVINLDVMLARRKMASKDLAEAVGIIRLSTLEAICRELACQPGDILEYRPDATDPS
jgi:putative transcriptional regulator